jgi:division protein CdvB (Snf7/Vps24/ESCRT-III family)
VSSSLSSRLENRLGIHQRPLKEQLAVVIYRIRTQRNKIESMGLTMQRRDKEFFDKCVAARAAGDTARANLYAEECAEVRKMAKIALNSELALEQLTFKLETAEMMGDVGFLIHPIKGVVATVGQQIQHMMPEVSFELSQINESLEGIVVNAGDVSESIAPVEGISPEADKILREADTLAEEKIKSRFPELTPTPSAVPTQATQPAEQSSQQRKMPMMI